MYFHLARSPAPWEALPIPPPLPHPPRPPAFSTGEVSPGISRAPAPIPALPSPSRSLPLVSADLSKGKAGSRPGCAASPRGCDLRRGASSAGAGTPSFPPHHSPFFPHFSSFFVLFSFHRDFGSCFKKHFFSPSSSFSFFSSLQESLPYFSASVALQKGMFDIGVLPEIYIVSLCLADSEAVRLHSSSHHTRPACSAHNRLS